MSGKGSNPRPFSVDRKTFESNWNKIFGKKTKKNSQKTFKKQKTDIY